MKKLNTVAVLVAAAALAAPVAALAQAGTIDNWRNGDGLRDAGPYPRVRVARGGSFRFGASLARASYRFRETPGRRSHNLGVRPSKRVAAP